MAQEPDLDGSTAEAPLARPVPPPSLRARKKAATMRHVQATALTLFRERDFDGVTVEQVAEAAEVSASTVYRYFGTKEGLVLHDEYDDRLLVGLVHYLREGTSPMAAAEQSLALIGEQHFGADQVETRERMTLWFTIPSVRAEGYLRIDEVAEQVAHEMASTGRWTFAQSRVISSALISALVAAVRNWHEAGEGEHWRPHVEEALAAVRSLAPGEPAT